MKTKCYCIFCKKHPLHKEQDKFKDWLVGWEPGNFIKLEFKDQGKEVDCLEPVSEAFYELGREPEEFEYPVTAYGDGNADTGVEGPGFIIYACCTNEEHEEL